MVTQDVCQTSYKINYELVKLKLRKKINIFPKKDKII